VKRAPATGGGSGGARLSPRSLPALARSSWRHGLSALLALALFLLLLSQHRSLYRHGQNAFASLYYGLDPLMLGRSDARFPAPRCCPDDGCAAGSGSETGGGSARVAVVTYLRDDLYAPLLQQLECTLRRSNPGLELALLHVPGELGTPTLALAAALNITLLPVAPLDFRNTYEPRCASGSGAASLFLQPRRRPPPRHPWAQPLAASSSGKLHRVASCATCCCLAPMLCVLCVPPLLSRRYSRNWLKVRALGLTQYDRVLLVDADVAVAGSLAPLLAMPVEFAAVWDQSKWLNRCEQGACSWLRCAAKP
jgi:hypothetical protein